MLLKTGQCFTEELELNCPTIVACVTALPVGSAAVAGETPMLGKDGKYHVIPPAVTPVPQTLSRIGQTIALSGGGGSVTMPDLDTQDLSLVGNVLSLTNGGSVTLPTSAAPIPQVLSIAGQVLALSGGGGQVLLPDIDTQDLSILGNVISLTNGGSVTLPAPAPTAVVAGSRVSVTGSGTPTDPYVVSQPPKLHAQASTGECPVVNFYPGLSNVGDVIHTSQVCSITNPSNVFPMSGTYFVDTNGFNAVTYPGTVYAIGTEVSQNGTAWSPFSQMSFSNQAGVTPENYTGSAIPSSVRNFYVAPGGTFTVQTRSVLIFKGPLTANDVITSMCIAQGMDAQNHD